MIKQEVTEMITSCVRTVCGTPALFINDKLYPANAYITYDVRKARYDDFAGAGFHLYSVNIMFGSQPFSETSRLPSFHPGIFEGEEPDYSVADGLIYQILKADPEAFIFPRLNISVPESWELAHPDELLDSGFGPHPRVCFSSELWAAESKRLLELYLDHVSASDYADHIVGYQLSDGNTQEWFPFDENGGQGKRSREAFARMYPGGSEADYYRYVSENTAKRICDIAAFAKEKTGRRVIIGTFYGYTFECPGRARCHHDLARVLACPDIDFISAPVSYLGNREPGNDHPYMLPLDSLILHGKMYFAENDTRTHLTAPPNDLPAFRNPVWQPKPKDRGLEGMRMQAARALTHGAGYWWFDMWGGWYADPDNIDVASRYLSLFRENLGADRRSRSEIAVIIDELSFCSIPANDPSGSNVCNSIRISLGRIGAPYNCYLASDFGKISSDIKLFVILEPRSTPKIDDIISDLRDVNVPFIEVTPEHFDYSTDELRELASGAGVFLYTDRPAVVYASSKYVFVHACSDEPLRVSAPSGRSLSLLDGNADGTCGKGALYEVG